MGEGNGFLGRTTKIVAVLVALIGIPTALWQAFKAVESASAYSPYFVIRYYSFDSGTTVSRAVMGDEKGLSHPLTNARQVLGANGQHVVPFEPTDSLKKYFPQFQFRGDGFSCRHYVLHVEYGSDTDLSDVFLEYEEVAKAANLNTDFSYRLGNSDNPNTKLAVGAIRRGDSFLIPIALECNNTRFLQTYMRYLKPARLTYKVRGLFGSAGTFSIRDAYPNPTSDHVETLIRG